MDGLGHAFLQALRLVVTCDHDVVAAVSASLRFSLLSTVLASAIGIPLGAALALVPFRGRQLAVAFSDTLLALPTVVVGLAVYAALSRQGPLGGLGLLFSPTAIVIGQAVLLLPICVALCRAAVVSVDPAFGETARTLGAGPIDAGRAVLWEARVGVLIACGTAFGRALGEVGISMMLGGNIEGFTRTMTTVIALETSKGEFELALALGLVLMALALALNLAIRAGRRGRT